MSTHELTVLMADPVFDGCMLSDPHVSILSPTTAKSADIARPGTDFFVVAAATELGLVADLVHEANSSHRLRALFVREDIDSAWFIPMLERANVRTLRNMLVHTSSSVPERVLRAWQRGAQDELIGDAAVADDRLFVRSCALERFELGFSQIAALNELPASQRAHFTVDPDGSFLHWECGDVHVGLDMIRYALDPAFRHVVDLRRVSFDTRFGASIKSIRLDKGLRQSDIVGLSEKQISRIEAGIGTPRLNSVRKLAAAHGLDTESYLGLISTHLSVGREGELEG